jgi:hypothetical protein
VFALNYQYRVYSSLEQELRMVSWQLALKLENAKSDLGKPALYARCPELALH